jgi:hypothetical protein
MKRAMNELQKYLSTCLLATAALLGGVSTAFAAAAPPLGTAGDFVVLSAPLSGGAVSTTASTITGNVGSSGTVFLTDTTITGNVVLTGVYTQVPAAPPTRFRGVSSRRSPLWL